MEESEFKGEVPGADTAKNQRGEDSSLKKALHIYQFVKPHRWLFILGMGLLLATSGVSLAFPYVFGKLLDSVVHDTEWVLNSRTEVALGLCSILVLQGLLSFFRIYILALVSQRTMADIRTSVFRKMITLSLTFFEGRRVGELTSRLTNDVGKLERILSHTLAEFLRQASTVVIGLIIVVVYAPRLTFFMVLVLPVIIIVAVFLGRYMRKLSRKTQDLIAKSNVIVEESIHNIKIVKAFTNEIFELKKYIVAIRGIVKMDMKSAVAEGAFVSFVIVMLLGSVVLVVWYGLGLVSEGIITTGELVSFMVYTGFIGGAVAGLGGAYSELMQGLGASERVQGLLDNEQEVDLDRGSDGPKLGGAIKYENVKYSYPARKDVEVLKGISFELKAGQKIALTGSSGAGKSTIVQLLLRFFNPDSGEIYIDGKPITEYGIHRLRQNVGIVPQEVILFGGTILENILYGRPDATQEEVLDAADKANALEFIERFPSGFETIVGERGVKLSGGQRQRIAIARAILKNPSILVLDEATSSLDAESEHLVQGALNALMENRSTIIIAHRLGTIRNVDQIYIMDEGRIAQSGTHTELREDKDGIYHKLLSLQLDL